MNWLNNIISDFQRKVTKVSGTVSHENSGLNRLREKQSEEKLHQFQSRLEDLDRRLMELR